MTMFTPSQHNVGANNYIQNIYKSFENWDIYKFGTTVENVDYFQKAIKGI